MEEGEKERKIRRMGRSMKYYLPDVTWPLTPGTHGSSCLHKSCARSGLSAFPTAQRYWQSEVAVGSGRGWAGCCLSKV